MSAREFADGQTIAGEPSAGRVLCVWCLGEGLDLWEDEICSGCDGSGIEPGI